MWSIPVTPTPPVNDWNIFDRYAVVFFECNHLTNKHAKGQLFNPRGCIEGCGGLECGPFPSLWGGKKRGTFLRGAIVTTKAPKQGYLHSMTS